MKKILVYQLLVYVTLMLTSVAHATVIDNGTMLVSTGGSCSTCSDLDSPNWRNADDLTLAVDSILNSIEFEINFYSTSHPFSNDTDFRIGIWDDTHTTQLVNWDFDGSELLSSTFLGGDTYSMAYDLGDYFLSAGDYDISIQSDWGAHALSASSFIAGGASDGSYRQYRSNGTFGSTRAGDLPFRLTVNEEQIPVPEPSTILLLGVGIVGLVAQGRRKK